MQSEAIASVSLVPIGLIIIILILSMLADVISQTRPPHLYHQHHLYPVCSYPDPSILVLSFFQPCPWMWSLTHGACAVPQPGAGHVLILSASSCSSFPREHRKQIEHSTNGQQERHVTSTWRASVTQERLELSPCDSALSCGVQGFRVGGFEALPHRLLLG